MCEKTRTLFLRTIFSAVCGGGGGVYRGPRATTYSTPNTNYHRLGWRSTDRPLPRTAQRDAEGSDEVGHISAFMHPATLAVGSGRAPHFRRVPRGGCCSGGRSLRFCMPSFGLGTTKP